MRNIVKEPKVTWIDIRNPTEIDIQYLRKKFNFHPLVLEEIITPSAHRPKVEHYDNYLFLVIYYPIHSREKRETRPRKLSIFVTKNTVITGHYQSILPLKNLLDICTRLSKARKKYMGTGGSGQLLFHILNRLWKGCLIKLERIDIRLDKIEEEIFKGKERAMVLEISLVKTDIINFWRIIEPQQKILESLEKTGVDFFGESLAPYFSDLLDTYHQARNSLQRYKETILALEATNQSLLSTKINEVIRILTVFSVILLPLTLIASIWGMNVPLPFAQSPYGFWILTGLMVLLIGFLIYFFHKKEWL